MEGTNNAEEGVKRRMGSENLDKRRCPVQLEGDDYETGLFIIYFMIYD